MASLGPLGGSEAHSEADIPSKMKDVISELFLQTFFDGTPRYRSTEEFVDVSADPSADPKLSSTSGGIDDAMENLFIEPSLEDTN